MLRAQSRIADIRALMQHLAGPDDCSADLDETALAVLALVAGDAH